MAVQVAPEFESVEVFVQEKYDNEENSYNHEELRDLAASVRQSTQALVKELGGYGLTLAHRPKVKVINQRTSPYAGMHGGSGASNIFGMAGNAASPGGGV
jgi:hypothetical protein